MQSNKLTDYVAYFREIARTNTRIKGFYHGNADEIIGATRTEINYPALWLETPSLVLTDNGAQQIMGNRVGAITILKNAPTDNQEQKDLILEECEEILLQCLAKMRKDRKERLISFNFNGSHIDAIAPLSTDNDHGFRLEFHLDKFIEICFDSTQWDDSKTL